MKLFKYYIVFLTFFIASCSGDVNNHVLLAENELINIRYDLNVLNKLPNDESSFRAKEEIVVSMIRKILVVRSLNPDVGQIGGEPLETICLLAEFELFDEYSESIDPSLLSSVRQYLGNIQHDVIKKIRDIQKSMKGKGCYLTPRKSGE